MPSKLVNELAPFHVMEVLEKAKEFEKKGADVIHFEIGEPDLPTHADICGSAVKSIMSGETRYSESLGIPELRHSISENFNKRYGIEPGYGRIAVTLGSSPAIFLTLLSVIEPGEEVIVIEPHYPCYPQLIRIAGGVPVSFRVHEENGFQIDIKELTKFIGKKTKAIIVNSPSNPTGVITEPEILRQLTGLGLRVISDEIYHGLEYGKKAHSMLEYSDDVFVLNGFSKLYSMTGWRLGYCIVPHEFIRSVQKLQQNLFISPNPFVQRAGLTALKMTDDDLNNIVSTYNNRRLAMLSGLRKIGFDIRTEPGGAFYIFLNVSGVKKNSYDLAFDILEKVHLAVTPGIDFGKNCDGFLRLTYTNTVEVIEQGLERLSRYFDKYAE